MAHEGFDVHHLDGDHENNDPANLVLIEHTDHMMMHDGRTMGRLKARRGPRQARRPKRVGKHKHVSAADKLGAPREWEELRDELWS